MEVCGRHTRTIFKYGIEGLLPSNVELVHGPGCPVCVLPMGRVDDGIAVAHQPEVIFICFGDMIRVPGSNGSLLDARAQEADVRTVYSPLDAMKIAQNNPGRQVVFYAIGFETTAPSTALTLLHARAARLKNFFVFCNHVTIIPPIKAILTSPDLQLDGFLGPGHVSTVAGTHPYEFIPRAYGKPVVVTGFEPLDVLQAVHMVIRQINDGRCEVENQYRRVVHDEGNLLALEALSTVFKLRPHFKWRGLGFISQSALQLREEFAAFDAEQVFSVPGVGVAVPKPVSAVKCSRG
jgi:hydrogenase expression/formation protein HypD